MEWEDEMDPKNIEPLHGVRDRDKFEALVSSMNQKGWVGRPLVVTAGAGRMWAQTGSHRLAAARAVGLETVPVIIIDIDGVDGEVDEVEYDEYGRLDLGRDDEERAETLRRLGLELSARAMEAELREGWGC
jgi:ParB-like chromosome segregation protein Spo0J